MAAKKPKVPDKYKYDRNEAIKIPERIKRIFTTLKKDGKLILTDLLDKSKEQEFKVCC